MIENIGGQSAINAALNAALNEGVPTGKSSQNIHFLSIDDINSRSTDDDLSRQLEKMGLPKPDIQSFNTGVNGAQFNGLSGALQLLEGCAEADIYAMMALFQEISQETRNAARENRHASIDAQVGALRNAADKILDAAEERFKGALAAGICQIAAGAVTIGSAVAAGQAMSKAGSTDASFQAAKVTADRRTAWGQGVSGVVGGAGAITQAVFDRQAGKADAARAGLEADAKAYESNVQEANEIMQQMLSVMQDIREKLGAIEQSQAEAKRGISRNI